MRIVFCSINDKAHKIGKIYTSCATMLEKSNNLDILTPTKTMVYGYKAWLGDTRFTRYKPVSEVEYIKRYRLLLKKRSMLVRKTLEALEHNRQDVTICCFCPPGKFCHRQLLAKWFKSFYKDRSDVEIELY